MAFDTNQMVKLKTAKAWADENQVAAGHQIVGPEKIREIEPHVSQKAIGALYGKGVSGGIYATEWTFALTENAIQNGLDLYLNSAVTDIKRKKDLITRCAHRQGGLKPTISSMRPDYLWIGSQRWWATPISN